MDTTQKILVTANKFNCTDLKLHAESILVEKFLTAETAAALLILADSHDCALLKEASMDFCVSEPSTVKQTEAWSNVQRTLRVDISDEYHSWVVSSLRSALQENDLEVDGSRKVLIQRLHDHHSTAASDALHCRWQQRIHWWVDSTQRHQAATVLVAAVAATALHRTASTEVKPSGDF
eukprot:jgi/Psemu1/65245/estExt_Genemark1.C_1120060